MPIYIYIYICKDFVINCVNCGPTPPLSEILDPPLQMVSSVSATSRIRHIKMRDKKEGYTNVDRPIVSRL